MPLQTVRMSRLYRQVAEQIADLIQAGELRPGQRLPSERELSARMSVSRPTVREAMLALEIAGLVEIRTGSGVYVASDLANRTFNLDKLQTAGASPLELVNARLAIETAVMREAVPRITEADVARLAQSIDDMAQAVTRAAYEDADVSFHLTIAEATGNSVLVAIVEELLQEIRSPLYERTSRVTGLIGENEPPTIGEHRDVLAAIEAKDTEAAVATMRSHLVNVRAFLERDWRERRQIEYPMRAAE